MRQQVAFLTAPFLAVVPPMHTIRTHALRRSTSHVSPRHAKTRVAKTRQDHRPPQDLTRRAAPLHRATPRGGMHLSLLPEPDGPLTPSLASEGLRVLQKVSEGLSRRAVQKVSEGRFRRSQKGSEGLRRSPCGNGRAGRSWRRAAPCRTHPASGSARRTWP